MSTEQKSADVAAAVGLEDKKPAAAAAGRRASKTDAEVKAEAPAGEPTAATPPAAGDGAQITLYLLSVSANSTIPWIVATALGVDFEAKFVDVMKGETRVPEYLAKFPAGHAPAMSHGDFDLAESCSMAKYLCNLKPEKSGDLYPTDLKARALVEQALDYRLSEFYPALHHAAYPALGFRPPFKEGEAEATNKELVAKLAIFEKLLGPGGFVAGDKPSIADIAMVSSLKFAEAISFKHTETMAAYLAKVHAAVPEIEQICEKGGMNGMLAGAKAKWDEAAAAAPAAAAEPAVAK